jgi:hypothetical protein
VSARPSDLAAALVDSLDDAALDELAAKLAPRLAARLGQDGDEWLDAKRTAAYLGMSIHALHRLTAARTIPFHQDHPNARLWFRRSEVDAWREAGREGPR